MLELGFKIRSLTKSIKWNTEYDTKLNKSLKHFAPKFVVTKCEYFLATMQTNLTLKDSCKMHNKHVSKTPVKSSFKNNSLYKSIWLIKLSNTI